MFSGLALLREYKFGLTVLRAPGTDAGTKRRARPRIAEGESYETIW